MDWRRVTKLLVYIGGEAVILASAGLFDDRTEAVILGVASILTGLGIYQAKNKPSPTDSTATSGGSIHV